MNICSANAAVFVCVQGEEILSQSASQATDTTTNNEEEESMPEDDDDSEVVSAHSQLLFSWSGLDMLLVLSLGRNAIGGECADLDWVYDHINFLCQEMETTEKDVTGNDDCEVRIISTFSVRRWRQQRKM